MDRPRKSSEEEAENLSGKQSGQTGREREQLGGNEKPTKASAGRKGMGKGGVPFTRGPEVMYTKKTSSQPAESGYDLAEGQTEKKNQDSGSLTRQHGRSNSPGISKPSPLKGGMQQNIGSR